ncbi:MAG: OmpA family protein [Planctomycetaceae bacterium]|nr:OmpA family protein [Planctomycetaceae bacterium]
MRTATLVTIATLGASFAALTGCVPQNQYDDLMSAYRSKEQQLLTMQGELDTSRANEEMLRKQFAEAAADLKRARELAGGDKGEIDALQKRYEELLAQVNNLSPLPESVNEALTKLAEENPDLFEFDAKRGMLRFKSDVTFDLGSAKLTSKATGVLKQFASILNSGAASDLEVRVVGHTDNVPIRRSSTMQQHPTNVHLSAHRAISVREALVGDGVSSNRFMVAGYGEFRPIATNSARGSEQNRRVEVFLVPMPANALESTGTTTNSGSTTVNAGSGTTEPENFK